MRPRARRAVRSRLLPVMLAGLALIAVPPAAGLAALPPSDEASAERLLRSVEESAARSNNLLRAPDWSLPVPSGLDPEAMDGANGGAFGLDVQAIVLVPEQPLALIDNSVFGEGDRIGPFEILRIEPDRLTLQHNDEVLVLPVDPSVPVDQWPGPMRGEFSPAFDLDDSLAGPVPSLQPYDPSRSR